MGELIDLDCGSITLLAVNDLVTESKSELLALGLASDISMRDGSAKDGDWASKRALHGQ